MTINKVYKSMITVIILFLGLFTMSIHANTRIIRVGFFAMDGYHMIDKEGKYSGYGYELLQHIAGDAGLRFSYIGYDKTYNELVEMLANDDIDLLTASQKTPELEERFAFTNESIGDSIANLTTYVGNEKFLTMDYNSWDGIRIGLLKDDIRINDLQKFASQNDFTYSIVYYDTLNEMSKDLHKDSPIDAMISTSLHKYDQEILLASFSISPFYIMLRKDDTLLLDDINNAIVKMYINEPGFCTELMNKYYSDTNTKKSELVFTSKELEFIKNNQDKVFSAMINPNMPPYSSYKDGTYEGIFYDIAKEIISRSKLNIAFSNDSSINEYFPLKHSDDIDIYFDAEYDYQNAASNNYWLTTPYISIPIARLNRETIDEFNTCALIKDSIISKEYKEELINSGLKVTEYETTEEIVSAIMQRKEDIGLFFIHTAELIAWEEPTSSLITSEFHGLETEFSLAIKNDNDSCLYSIISKAAFSITEEDINQFTLKHEITGDKKIDFIGYCINHPTHAVIFALGCALIAILIIWLTNTGVRKRKLVLQVNKEKEQALLLKDALESAELAEKSKSKFLSTVSHEMRTPLNGIIGFIELAKDANIEQTRSYLDSCEIAARQLVSVINDVLDMSAIQAGKTKINDAPFDLKQIIKSITSIFATQCQNKGITFEIKLISNVDEYLIGDQLRINQILYNLLGNAIKFTEKGKISLLISQSDTIKDKAFIRFTISDTGCGISEEMQTRLFKPFEQESSETTVKHGGSGLGLSIVKSLVTMMRGTITFESKQDVGTTFFIDIPFEKDKNKHSESSEKTIESLHILVVDDDEIELKYISSILNRMKIKYTCVQDGYIAIDELEKAKKANDMYNVCLIDWKMPHIDGIATTRLIHEKYGNDIGVIVVSAYDLAKSFDEAKQAGANMFLPKPVFQSTLYDMLVTLTGGKGRKNNESNIHEYKYNGEKILLAEDNYMNQAVVAEILKKMNINCDIASNGKIAYEMFTSSKPGEYKAILMDVHMPNIDGLEATRMIRASDHPEAKSIQIIAQTADAFDEDIAKVISAGMNYHISKPIDINELGSVLDSVLKLPLGIKY